MTATARVSAGVPAGGQFASHNRPDGDVTLPSATEAGTVISARITRYDEVIVEVEPYITEINGRTVLISSFLGDATDRGGYMIGRGKQVKKDGTVGTRTILNDSGRTPANVRAAAAALFEHSAPPEAADVAIRIDKLGQRLIATSEDTLSYLDEFIDVAADAEGLTLAQVYEAGRPSGQTVMLGDIVSDLARVEDVVKGPGFPKGYDIKPRTREVLYRVFVKFRMADQTDLFDKTHRYVCAQFSDAATAA